MMRFFAIAFFLFAAVVSCVFASPVVQRDTTQSAAVILTNLQNEVLPLINQLLYATQENATEANLEPIISEISTSVTSAVSSLQLLSGQSAAVILASVDGTQTLAASDIANLLASIVDLIFQAIEAVIQVVDPSIYTSVYDLLTTLGKLVLNLISALLPLATGLVTLLVQLIEPILSIVSTLGLAGLLSSILGGLL